MSVVDESLHSEEEPVRTSAMAARELFDDLDAGFTHALSESKRVVALGSEQSAVISHGKG